MRKPILLGAHLLLGLLVVVAGCSITQTKAHESVGTGARWPTQEDKDAGLVGLASGFNIKNYDVIAVSRFPVAAEDLKDDEDKALAAQMQPLLQSEIVRHLSALGLFREVVALSETESTPRAGKVLMLDGKISRLSGGSQALRYFVGFGAGRSKAQVETRFTDAQSGEVVMVTADRRVGSFGFFGGDSNDFLKESFDEIARSLGKFLFRLSKGEAPRAE